MHLLLFVLLILAASEAAAATPCSGAEHRQFDFWLGNWRVMGGRNGDQFQGKNRIERSKDGCRVVEYWSGAGGMNGMSLNAWDANHRVWRQFWVGGDGVVLSLEGKLIDGVMLMEGELAAANGGVQRQRITWTPQAEGKVQQKWEVSDDGQQWSISFLGLYLPD